MRILSTGHMKVFPFILTVRQTAIGVYSGSALAEEETLHLFYTGNVKLDGDYDYINNGRCANTLHVEVRTA